MLAKERNRWHPDKQKMKQKGKDVDDETLRVTTATFQVLNALRES